MELVQGIQCAAVVGTAFVTSWLVTRYSVSWLRRRNIVGIPNERSLHNVPTPSGGGIGILAGIVAAGCLCLLLGLPVPSVSILAGAAIVAVIGFIDDAYGGIRISIRLCLQLFAAGLVVWGTGGLTQLPFPEPLRVDLGLASIPLTMLWIVGVTNIYNFLDGIDGYAATQGLIAGIALASLSPLSSTGLVGLAICGGCLGFLPFNWHRASVFMGDVGSLTLGFLVASLPLQASATSRADWVLASALVLWFFLADGTFTFVRRLMRGERVWDAHRSHLYQRLVLADYSHVQVVRMMAVGAAAMAGIAVVATRQSNNMLQWLAIMLGIALIVVFHQITLMAERSHATALRPTDGNQETSRST